MKKLLSISVPLAVILTVLLLPSSCEKFTLPEINFAPDSLFFGKAAETKEIFVQSNVNWTIYVPLDKENSWFTVEPLTGFGDQTVKVTVSEAKADSLACSIQIYSEIISKPIFIQQKIEKK